MNDFGRLDNYKRAKLHCHDRLGKTAAVVVGFVGEDRWNKVVLLKALSATKASVVGYAK